MRLSATAGEFALPAGRTYSQNRARRTRNDLRGNTPKKEPGNSAVLVGADHNQVNFQPLRRLHDRVIRKSR
jgi:hypothetical protein